MDSCLLVEFGCKVGIVAGKHGLRQSVFHVLLFEVAQGRAVSVVACKRGIDEVGVIQHELLDSSASAGAGVPGLVKVLKKRRPREGVSGGPAFLRAVVYEPAE